MSIDVRLPILLRELRLPTVAANYRKFAHEAAQTGQCHEEYLLALLEGAATCRRENTPVVEGQAVEGKEDRLRGLLRGTGPSCRIH